MMAYPDSLRKPQRPRELAGLALTMGIRIFLIFLGDLGFSGDGEMTVVYLYVHILLLHAWQLEGHSHDVLRCVFVEVHSVDKRSNQMTLKQ